MSSNNSTLDAAIQRARHGQQALSKLFQACDLLSAALTHSDGDNGPEELAARTLTKGALSRIESAVSELDNVVPHPADEPAEIETDGETPRLYDALYEYSAQLEYLSSVVFLASEQSSSSATDSENAMRLVDRDIKRLSELVSAAGERAEKMERAL